MHPVRVLIVADGHDDARARALLGAGFAVYTAAALGDALVSLGTGDVDLLLVDPDLPDATRDEVLRALVDEDRPPVVLLTDDDAFALRAIRAGAQDHVTRKADPGHLARTVRHALVRQRHLATLRHARDLLEWENCELIAENVELEVRREHLEEVVSAFAGRASALVN